MWNVLQNSSTSFLHLRYSSRHSLSIVELFTCISKSFFNSSILLFCVNNYFTIKLSTIEKIMLNYCDELNKFTKITSLDHPVHSHIISLC